jgi:hypothetical protein
MTDVAAHTALQSHKYNVHFPPHPARTSDPHYVDFNAYHNEHRAAALCYVGQRIGFDWCCDPQGVLTPQLPPGGPLAQAALELHHAHVEFSLQNGISLTALEVDFPGISNSTDVGAWIETDQNFRWLCCQHHRGPGGAHTAAHADWEAAQYVLGLISK